MKQWPVTTHEKTKLHIEFLCKHLDEQRLPDVHARFSQQVNHGARKKANFCEVLQMTWVMHLPMIGSACCTSLIFIAVSQFSLLLSQGTVRGGLAATLLLLLKEKPKCWAAWQTVKHNRLCEEQRLLPAVGARSGTDTVQLQQEQRQCSKAAIICNSTMWLFLWTVLWSWRCKRAKDVQLQAGECFAEEKVR